jgi:adenine phosphoribosyltransferase
MQSFKSHITNTPDFPAKGIVFRDISPLLREKFVETIDSLAKLYSSTEWAEIDCIGGIESRGFLFAAPLAYKLKKGLVMVRKKGKLPNPAASLNYTLEYGEATLEMHAGKGKMMILDDVLATGGTLTAAANLADKAGYDVKALGVLIDLNIVKDFKFKEVGCRSLIRY